jgi:hypothetical protein
MQDQDPNKIIQIKVRKKNKWYIAQLATNNTDKEFAKNKGGQRTTFVE